MANSSSKGLGLPETKGQFQVKGIVVGTTKQSFYTDKLTATSKKPFRAVNFGLQVQDGKSIYVNVSGMEQELVYFSKSEINPLTQKRETDTQKIPWKDRHAFDQEGYRLIGVNLGIEKVVDENGKEVNDKKTLVAFDACSEIAEKLYDGASLFTRGDISYSTYNDKRQVRFEPRQLSLAQPIDFTAEDYTPIANYEQTIVYTGISQSEDKSKYIVSAKIVTYNSVEDAEFEIREPYFEIAHHMKKNIKPYSSVHLWGDIFVEQHIEDVQNSGVIGSPNRMKRVTAPTSRIMLVTGLDPQTIDSTIYSEDVLLEALSAQKRAKQAVNDFGSSDKIGTPNSFDANLDDGESPWD